MTRVIFNKSNLAGAIFDTSDVSGASMADATFGQYRIPAKLEAKKQAKDSVCRLTMQLGKATVAAAMEAAGDEEDDDDDDDADQKEDSAEAQALLASMAKEAVECYASVVANVVPQVIAACEKADQAIDAAVEEAKAALDVDSRALEEAVSASTDGAKATAAVESLMQTTLHALLDKVFSEGGTLPELLDEAKKDLVDAVGDASGDAGTLLKDGAELGLPHVLKLLRSTVQKHADALLKRLVAGVAEKIAGRFVSAAAAAARLRSLKGRSAKVSVSDQSDATEQLLDSPERVCRKALDTLLDSVSACLDDPSAVTRHSGCCSRAASSSKAVAAVSSIWAAAPPPSKRR
jgi:hypothetical protein